MAERADRELSSEIKALWGDRLEVVPAGRLPRGVAPAVAEILTTVGLPTVEVQGIAFVHNERMSYLIEHLDRGYLLLSTIRRGSPYLVAEPDDGQVSVFTGDCSPCLRLVGSSLPLFLVALGVWRRDVWAPTVAGISGEDLLAAYERFETLLAELDPAAAVYGGYWPGLLERLREGIER